MYQDTRAIYSLGNIDTDWVHSQRGVRQGCVLSPLLFAIYTEELAIRIRKSGYGIRVGSEKLGCLLYADDIVIMSEDSEELQEMLDLTAQYGRDFDMSFSSVKSQVVVVNADGEDDGRAWRIGEMEIGRTDQYKYLGIMVDENGTDRTKLDRIAKANQWVGRLGSVARCRANRYEVVRGVWKGMAVPGLMYGLECMRWTAKDLDKLEVVQNRVARLALGANRYVAVEALRGEAGWSTFDERIGKAVLQYKVRLGKMDEDRWARRVYEWACRGSKWEKASNQWEKKCGMQGFTRSEMMVVNSEKEIKRKVKDKIQEKGLQKWSQGVGGKSSLEWYQGKARPKSEAFYDGSLGSILLFKARTKSLEVNSRVYRWANEGSKECRMCTWGVDETIVHVLIECPCYGGRDGK